MKRKKLKIPRPDKQHNPNQSKNTIKTRVYNLDASYILNSLTNLRGTKIPKSLKNTKL